MPGAGSPAPEIARRAHRRAGAAQRIDPPVAAPRMAYPDRPWGAPRVRSSQIHVAAGGDGKIPEPRELARRRVHGEALRHGAEVERQAAAQRDGFSIRIELHVAVADIVIGRDRGADDLSGAMFPVETARLHPMADGRV